MRNMKKWTIVALLMMSAWVSAAPFYVCVNDTLLYLANPTGQADFQNRTQYLASCVALQSGDRLTCFDAENNANWHISALDPYGSYANFNSTAAALVCNVAGTYNLYIKMAYEDDIWYVEAASDCTPAEPFDPSNPPVEPYVSSAPANCPDVMLQGFYWDSYEDKGYGRTKWIDLKTQAVEMGQWFDLIWLPPSAKATGGTGYLPRQYSSQDSDWGTKVNLLSLIGMLHENGARVVADVVVNHVSGKSSWCDFYALDFGEFGTFAPDMSWICSTDEAFTGGHCNNAWGAADDGYGSEANYEAGRDWDHQNAEVRAMIKAYLKWLRKDIGYDGFRYDYCKGFHNSHINEYNTAAEAYFSVMEYWDGNPEVLKSHLGDAGWNTLTFDFATKYTAFNNGIASGNYGGCKGAGLLGAGKSRYAVTFLDSHDSFQRDDNEFCGKNNSMRYPDKVLQCNAYLLSMPGVPCIFYPHWVAFKEQLKPMINARYKTGVHSESSVQDEAGNGFYKATITGTNGSIRLLLGPNSGYDTTPAGYTLAVKGQGYGVYYQVNSDRGNKNENRTPVGDRTALEETEAQSSGCKFIQNGQLFIQTHDGIYDAIGRKIK